MRKLNYTRATTFTQFLESRDYDIQAMDYVDIIDAATEMREWLRSHFINEFTVLHLALGILALKHGGEIRS